MSKRVCSGPNPDTRCPNGALVRPPKRRCPACGTQYERARGTRQQRGYGAEHDAERARWAPLVATGNVKCWRCGEYIPAGPFDLGHDDRDRSKYRGPEHVSCNRATASR